MKIDCCRFVDSVAERGWQQWSGVPCSAFDGPIAHLTELERYVPAPHEGLALSYAVGAGLAGRPTAVMLQNSGLGNLVNPLASLAIPYRAPVLAFMSMRGWPDPSGDEAQHAAMGSASTRILDALGVAHEVLDAEDVPGVLDRAARHVEAGRTAFVLVPMGLLGRHPTPSSACGAAPDLPTDADMIRAVAGALAPDAVVVSTTGYTSRHLFAAGDRPRNFYMQGSMGHATSLGLGAASSGSLGQLVVLDGDGGALMHLGGMPMVGAASATNVVHVIVDNGCYASTGGQATASHACDFAALARGAGYRSARTVSSTGELADALRLTATSPGPHCIVARCRSGPRDQVPARASAALTLPAVAARFAQEILQR